MKKNKVSILIVTYNSGKYIRNTIKSCLNQSYDNFNILILDNNSTDGTFEYLQSLNDNRIILYKSKENLGPYRGLNYLLERTDSEYVCIQDHDDIFHPEKIKYCVDFLNKNPDYIGCGHNVLVYFEREKKGYIYTAQENHVMHTSLFFRNKGFRYRNKKNIFLEDVYFQKKILGKNGNIGNINKVLGLHLIKKIRNNLSANWGSLSFKNIKKLFFVYGYGIYGFQIFLVFILKKMFPNLFSRIELKLLNKKYGIITYNKLLKSDDTKILIETLTK